eukprot:GHVP01009946.1.p1 GENE.GHVP01009946.1~~GHVP01009946.1.p1  ORF type:complete len:382 (+),score=72.83 GHVP01009946.1:2476-3621(+)
MPKITPRNCRLLLKSEINTPAFVIDAELGLRKHLTDSYETSLEFNSELHNINVADVSRLVSTCKKKEEIGMNEKTPVLLSFRKNRNSEPSIFFDKVGRVGVDTASGQMSIDCAELSDAIEFLDPDIVVLPSEERKFPGKLKLENKKTSIAESHLKALLSRENSKVHLILPLQCRKDSSRIRDSIDSYLKFYPNKKEEHPFGFYLSGLGYGESIKELKSALQISVPLLPQKCLRMTSIEGNPREILLSVLEGVDIFQIRYPLETADRGILLNFNCQFPNPMEDENLENLENFETLIHSNNNEILADNLADPKFRLDKTKVKRFHKGYIHHLLKCNEMLGPLIIYENNLEVYCCFFEEIRKSIKHDYFRKYATWFLSSQTVPK